MNWGEYAELLVGRMEVLGILFFLFFLLSDADKNKSFLLTGATLSFLRTYTEDSILTEVVGRIVMSLKSVGRFEVVCQEALYSCIVKYIRELKFGFVMKKKY